MAKSARASSRKTNNQKLKKNVFGPVEAARTERLSAKLMELVAQQVVSEVRQDKGDAAAMEVVADGAYFGGQETTFRAGPAVDQRLFSFLFAHRCSSSSSSLGPYAQRPADGREHRMYGVSLHPFSLSLSLPPPHPLRFLD